MHRRFSKATRREDGQRSRSRVYADVNSHRPREYWDYEGYEIEWGCPDGYFIHQCIGSGRYGEVYEGVNKRNEQCVVKILKPVKLKKIRREVKIVQNLTGAPNIVKLLDVVRDRRTDTPILVFEYLRNFDHRFLYPSLDIQDIRYYMFQVLKALDHCHSQGIMHRDVKPHNIVIDHDRHELRLIDWGLAEFYFPGKEYNVRVASRHFKAPELLVDLTDYDYAIDLWGVGCILAGMVFKKEPFFAGVDNADQLAKITKVLGTDELHAFLDKYGIQLDGGLCKLLGKRKKRSLHKFVNERNEDRALPDALDLIDKLLRFDHQQRLTSREAMEHPFFASVRELDSKSHVNKRNET